MGHTTLEKADSLKATVENPRGSVEKLSPKESVEGANTVLRGSVRATEGFSKGKPEAVKPRGPRREIDVSTDENFILFLASKSSDCRAMPDIGSSC